MDRQQPGPQDKGLRSDRVFMRRALVVCGLAVAGALVVQAAPDIMRALGAVWSACLPLVIGLVIAYVLDAVSGLWERVIPRSWCASGATRGVRRGVALLLAMLSAVALVAVVVLIVRADFPVLVDGTRQVATTLSTWLAALLDGPLNGLSIDFELPWDSWRTALDEVIAYLGGIGEISSRVIGWGNGAASGLLTAVIGIIFSFFALANKDRMVAGAHTAGTLMLSPAAYNRVLHACRVFNKTFRNYIAGQCLEAFILGSLCALGMAVLRFPYAGTVGVCVGVTAFVPYIGAVTGGCVGVLLIASQSVTMACWFVVYLVVLQQIESHVIYPNVMGNMVGLPGVWTFAAAVVGGALGGLLGIMVSVPTVSAVRQLAREYAMARRVAGDEEIRDDEAT